MLVPQVDADGNERDGVRLPEITVPLATYASWNLRDPSIGAPDQRVALEGSYIPFPKTAAERQKSGDPRKSIAERYSNRDDYMTQLHKAVDDLVKQRWILPEDRDGLAEARRAGMDRSDEIDFVPSGHFLCRQVAEHQKSIRVARRNAAHGASRGSAKQKRPGPEGAKENDASSFTLPKELWVGPHQRQLVR